MRRKRSSGGAEQTAMVLILVIGGLICIFSISNAVVTRDVVSEEDARRTARIVAVAAENAQIAGDQAIAEAGDVKTAVELLSLGVRGEGAFEQFEYKVHVPPERKPKVLRYLKFEEGNLTYDGSGDFD